MEFAYLVTPFAAWLTAGSLKFAINSLRAGRGAVGLIGYGGMPSNHSAIVTSMTVLIALREGIAHPAFGVALTVAFIVMMDAASLRRQVGIHARALNRLGSRRLDGSALRERIGHSRAEIAGGILTGAAVGLGMGWTSVS
ncbi:divergent PAP2 family protein [Achromobacter sp. GG226]|uniref:divergent PAP2 family protein n=1 Tax=Verticiella alkaliphila TaxID=2779529 RepID=UPI001C0AC5C1|nr:divergent PAP2 family protein [Verticiella sp. GG226]MBU4611148.1 divergent PAP2 family protein [Verticiella sp. GG226]